MRVINNGKGLKIEVSYLEAAILTEAIRKGMMVYERENAQEHADQTKELLNKLVNNQIIEMG